MSFSHQTWVLWVLSYRDERDVLKKAVLRKSADISNFQSEPTEKTSSNLRLPSPFITDARSVSVPGPVP